MNSGESPFPLGFKWRIFWEMSAWEAHTSFVRYSGKVVTALWCWSTVHFPEPHWWVCVANHNVQISGRSYGACILSPVGSATTLCTQTHKHSETQEYSPKTGPLETVNGPAMSGFVASEVNRNLSKIIHRFQRIFGFQDCRQEIMNCVSIDSLSH